MHHAAEKSLGLKDIEKHKKQGILFYFSKEKTKCYYDSNLQEGKVDIILAETEIRLCRGTHNNTWIKLNSLLIGVGIILRFHLPNICMNKDKIESNYDIDSESNKCE